MRLPFPCFRTPLPGPAPCRWGAVASLLLACLIAETCLPAFAQDALDDDYKLAVGLYNKNRWMLAAESFQAFIQKNPKHRKTEDARYYLGLTYINLENYKQAREVLRAFAKDYPNGRNVVPATFWIGQCSYLVDDYIAADAELAAFLKKAPDDPLREQALTFLGNVELRLNKPELAAQHFQQSIAAFPKGSLLEDARFGLARSYEVLRKNPEAIQLYQQLAANRTGTRAAEAQLKLASRYFEDGNFPAAAEAFDQLPKNFPQSPLVALARLNLGLTNYRLGEFRKAITDLDLAAQDPKHAADALLWKGLSLKSLAEYPQAIEVLKKAYEAHRDLPVAETLLYQWAHCELRRGSHDQARTLFLDVVTRWPKGTLAAESLHYACLAALNADNLPELEKLLARFDREFPGNKLRYVQEILKGQLLLAKKDPAGASKHFEKVVAESDVEATKAQGRYYLASAAQKLGNHQQVLDVTAPLVGQLEKDKSLAEFVSVHVLRSASFLALGKKIPKTKPQEKAASLTAATDAAQKYLAQLPNGPLADTAHALKTLAAAHSANKPAAQAGLQALRTGFPQSPELESTLFELGEVASDGMDWEWAESLFTELAARPKTSKYHARALLDLGYAQNERKRYTEAAATFARLAAEHPESDLLAEAAFRRGAALQDGGQLPSALTAFTETFQRFGVSDAAYLAGLERARLLARLKRPAEADTAYDELLKRFPKRADGDSLLNEWASTNQEAENFQRADDIYRRLIQEFPASKRAGQARLSLAESDLINGKINEARTQFTALSTATQPDPEVQNQVQQRALYQLIHIALELKKWDDLRKATAEYLQRFPEGTYGGEAEFHWAEADFQSQSYQAAQARLIKLKAKQNDPAFRQAAWYPKVWVMLAETQFRLKQFPDVTATVAAFRAWDAKSPLLYQADEVLGRTLKAEAHFPEARDIFERVIKDPNGRLTETAAQSQFYIAETHLLEKDYKKALLAYLKVEIRYKYPEWQAPALYQAAICHEALNEWKEAVKTYENMLRDYPASEYAAKAKERLELARKKAAG